MQRLQLTVKAALVAHPMALKRQAGRPMMLVSSIPVAACVIAPISCASVSSVPRVVTCMQIITGQVHQACPGSQSHCSADSPLPCVPPDAVYSALTATARKLAGKPSFMEAYRQKFPAIMASTERLLQTVEKQRRPAAAAAVAQEEAAAGPVAALALAAAAAAGHEVASPSPARQQAQQAQQSQAVDRWHSVDVEESTLDLMAQVIHSRPASGAQGQHTPRAAYDAGEMAAAVAAAERASSAAQPAGELQPCSTAALLSRAMGSTAAAAPYPGGGKRAASSLHAAPSVPTAAAPVGVQSAPRSELSKPQLEQAIAAALGRSAAAGEAGPAPAGTIPVAPPASTTLLVGQPAAAAPTRAAKAELSAPLPPPAAPPDSVVRSAACPPPPPPAPPAPAAATASAQAAVPPLRPVGQDEYSALPTFIRSGLPLDTLNAALAAVHAMLQERCANGRFAWLHEHLDRATPKLGLQQGLQQGLPTACNSRSHPAPCRLCDGGCGGHWAGRGEAQGAGALTHTHTRTHTQARLWTAVCPPQPHHLCACAGLWPPAQVVVNSLVKLGRVQLQVARGGQGGTLYLLV